MTRQIMRKESFFPWGRCPKPPGFIALEPEWLAVQWRHWSGG